MQWSMLPIGLFGLLNVFLAFIAPGQAQGAGAAAFMFGCAAALILVGLWRNNPLLLLVGALLGLIAPVLMGFLMSGNVNWLHIAVRLVIVALFFMLWMKFRPAP